jgi:hypothetical protein
MLDLPIVAPSFAWQAYDFHAGYDLTRTTKEVLNADFRVPPGDAVLAADDDRGASRQ